MASSETHFELFLRKSPKAGWALADAHSDRLKAIERAKYLLKDHPQGGVRVMKEVLKSDGSDPDPRPVNADISALIFQSLIC